MCALLFEHLGSSASVFTEAFQRGAPQTFENCQQRTNREMRVHDLHARAFLLAVFGPHCPTPPCNLLASCFTMAMCALLFEHLGSSASVFTEAFQRGAPQTFESCQQRTNREMPVHVYNLYSLSNSCWIAILWVLTGQSKIESRRLEGESGLDALWQDPALQTQKGSPAPVEGMVAQMGHHVTTISPLLLICWMLGSTELHIERSWKHLGSNCSLQYLMTRCCGPGVR